MQKYVFPILKKASIKSHAKNSNPTNKKKNSLSAGDGAWKSELAVQMVQALASAAVERRYGVSAEEMTAAGFQHAAQLQKNERFMRATEKQQELHRENVVFSSFFKF